MVLLGKLSDSCSALLRKRESTRLKGQSCPFLQLVSLELSLEIASGLRIDFIQ